MTCWPSYVHNACGVYDAYRPQEEVMTASPFLFSFYHFHFPLNRMLVCVCVGGKGRVVTSRRLMTPDPWAVE